MCYILIKRPTHSHVSAMFWNECYIVLKKSIFVKICRNKYSRCQWSIRPTPHSLSEVDIRMQICFSCYIFGTRTYSHWVGTGIFSENFMMIHCMFSKYLVLVLSTGLVGHSLYILLALKFAQPKMSLSLINMQLTVLPSICGVRIVIVQWAEWINYLIAFEQTLLCFTTSTSVTSLYLKV